MTVRFTLVAVILPALGVNWRSMVTSEFGWRANPFGGGGGEGHSGLDMGAPKGTPIQTARTVWSAM